MASLEGTIGTEKLLGRRPGEAGGNPVRPCPAAASATLRFSRFREEEALAGEWRRLEASASLPTQSLAFAAALSSTLVPAERIDVVLARDGEGIAALIPLERGAGPFARLRMIGAHDVCEPGDALCQDPDAARALAEAIVSLSRPVELDRVPAGSPLIPALGAALGGRGRMTVRTAPPTPIIALDASWQEPLSRFNSGRRSDFRRAARKAAEFGAVTFEMRSPSAGEFDALFDQAIAVEVSSWKREAGTAIAVDPAKERFFREYFRSACQCGQFRIAFMRIDGRAVATQMALECLDRYWLFKIGFDEAFGRCSPGTLLMLETISWAAKRGLIAYELLGKAEPWIAQLWTREQQTCLCLRTYPYNVRGSVAFAGDALAWLRKRVGARKR